MRLWFSTSQLQLHGCDFIYHGRQSEEKEGTRFGIHQASFKPVLSLALLAASTRTLDYATILSRVASSTACSPKRAGYIKAI